jgi:hypothetical protein
MFGRTVGWFAGGLVAVLASSLWWGPRMLTWWTTPPGQGIATMCSDQVRWATTRLVEIQLVAGAILGIALAALVGMWTSRRHAHPQPPSGVGAQPRTV